MISTLFCPSATDGCSTMPFCPSATGGAQKCHSALRPQMGTQKCDCIVQAMQIEAKPLSLVALQSPGEGDGPASFDVPAQHPSLRTFAFMVISLPSDSAAGTVSVRFRWKTVTCCGQPQQFAVAYAAAYADCKCTLQCAPGGQSLFVVYALEVGKVCVASESVVTCPAVRRVRCCARLFAFLLQHAPGQCPTCAYGDQRTLMRN